MGAGPGHHDHLHTDRGLAAGRDGPSRLDPGGTELPADDGGEILRPGRGEQPVHDDTEGGLARRIVDEVGHDLTMGPGSPARQTARVR